MDRKDFLKRMSSLIEEFERSNDNKPIDVYISLDTDTRDVYEWNGEDFDLRPIFIGII